MVPHSMSRVRGLSGREETGPAPPGLPGSSSWPPPLLVQGGSGSSLPATPPPTHTRTHMHTRSSSTEPGSRQAPACPGIPTPWAKKNPGRPGHHPMSQELRSWRAEQTATQSTDLNRTCRARSQGILSSNHQPAWKWSPGGGQVPASWVGRAWT
jgi:hypothetical protein